MRDLQSLCDRLDEIFNTDDTPDELSREAKEAIEELWEERDRLRALVADMQPYVEQFDCADAAELEAKQLLLERAANPTAASTEP